VKEKSFCCIGSWLTFLHSADVQPQSRLSDARCNFSVYYVWSLLFYTLFRVLMMLEFLWDYFPKYLSCGSVANSLLAILRLYVCSLKLETILLNHLFNFYLLRSLLCCMVSCKTHYCFADGWPHSRKCDPCNNLSLNLRQVIVTIGMNENLRVLWSLRNKCSTSTCGIEVKEKTVLLPRIMLNIH